jgi:hypothetical protein
MKNVVFWDVVPCRSCVKRRFGGMYRLHLQGRKIRERGTSISAVCSHLQRRFGENHRLHLQDRKIRERGTSVSAVCSYLLTLVPSTRIFLPWRRRRYIPPNRRSTQDLHDATSQKTEFFIVLNYLSTRTNLLFTFFGSGWQCVLTNGL